MIDGRERARCRSAPMASCVSRAGLRRSDRAEVRNGASVRLSDVADVEQGMRNTRSAAWFNGKPSVLLDHHQAGRRQRHRDGRPHLCADAGAASAGFPPGIDIAVLTDRTQTIRASVADMQLTLLRHHRSWSCWWSSSSCAARRRRSRPASRCRCRSPAPARAMWCVGFSIDNLSLMALVGLGRLRRRRCDRDDRERVPQHGSGHTPLQAALRGRAADRLHGAVDRAVADRRVHPAAVHGRHRRARCSASSR